MDEVNVAVGLYEGKEKTTPFVIPESWNLSNRDTFIEVGAEAPVFPWPTFDDRFPLNHE